MPQKAMNKFGKYVREHPLGVITTAGVGLAITGIPIVSQVGGVMALGGVTTKVLKKSKKGDK